MQFVHKNTGTCSSGVKYEIEDNIIKNVEIIGGCPGNTFGVSILCKNQSIDYIIDKLKGIKCGFKPTSCPDQLAKALEEYKKKIS